MAQQLPLNGFYAGESRKQSVRTCVNFMPVPGDPGDISSKALFTTTGIDRGVRLDRSAQPSTSTQWSGRGDGLDLVSFSGLIDDNVVVGDVTFSDGSRIETERTTIRFPLSVLGIGGFAIGTSSSHLVATVRATGIGSEGFARQGVAIYSRSQDGTYSTTIALSEEEGHQDLSLTDVAFMNGRFIYMNSSESGPLTRRIYYSGILDPIELDPLGFISLISQDGRLTGIEAINDRLYVFTNRAMAVFAPQPSVEIPFVELTGSSQQIGLASPFAKTQFGGSIFLIGQISRSYKLISVSGGSPKVISTKEIDTLLQRHFLTIDDQDDPDPTVNDENVFSFQDQGRSFIAFSFGQYTFCYDIDTGEFHRRSSSGDRWSVIDYADPGIFLGIRLPIIGGPHRFARANTGTGMEFGVLVDREMISSNFNSDGVTNRVSEIALQTEIDYSEYDPGFSNPNLSLSVSGDYGATFPDEEFRHFGGLGQYNGPMRWLSLGVFSEAFTTRIRTLNPYPHRINKMLAKLKKGIRQIS